MSNDNNTLVDSKVALSFFLDSLLKETELPETVVVEKTEVVIEEPIVSLVVKDEVVIESVIEAEAIVVKEPQLAPVIETPIEIPPSVEVKINATPDTQVELETKIEPEPEQEAIESVIEISKEPFQALMFKVAGLRLAVRLVELSGVLEWDEDAVTEMPGHSSFFMGMLQYLGKSIPIVDTARLVFPSEKLVSLNADKPRERIKRIVLIDDGKWGLACDEIADVVDLAYESVKWRENRSQRKWMAGTVIDQMCALIDTVGFSEMLNDGSHERK